MRQLIQVALAGLALLTVACTTEIDVNPSLDLPQEEAIVDKVSLESALTGAYSSLQSEYCYGGYFIILPEILADHVALRNPGATDADIYNRNITPDNEIVLNVWSESYKAINRANEVIDAIENKRDDIANLDANSDSLFLGEALFIRAVTHFELVRLFAPQFGEGPLAGHGIVLSTSPTTDNEAKPLATVEEVYEQVEADLLRAAELLPNNHPTCAIRADRYAAQGMLAVVHYQKGTEDGDAKALQQIENVLGAANDSYPLSGRKPSYPNPNGDRYLIGTTIPAGVICSRYC